MFKSEATPTKESVCWTHLLIKCTSASPELSAIVVWALEHDLIKPPLHSKIPPNRDFMLGRSPAQTESVYPSNWLTSLPNAKCWLARGLPFWYLVGQKWCHVPAQILCCNVHSGRSHGRWLIRAAASPEFRVLWVSEPASLAAGTSSSTMPNRSQGSRYSKVHHFAFLRDPPHALVNSLVLDARFLQVQRAVECSYGLQKLLTSCHTVVATCHPAMLPLCIGDYEEVVAKNGQPDVSALMRKTALRALPLFQAFRIWCCISRAIKSHHPVFIWNLVEYRSLTWRVRVSAAAVEDANPPRLRQPLSFCTVCNRLFQSLSKRSWHVQILTLVRWISRPTRLERHPLWDCLATWLSHLLAATVSQTHIFFNNFTSNLRAAVTISLPSVLSPFTLSIYVSFSSHIKNKKKNPIE